MLCICLLGFCFFGSNYWIQCMKCFENLIKKTQTQQQTTKQTNPTNQLTKKKKKIQREKTLKRVSQELVLIPIFHVLEQAQGKTAGCPGMLNVCGGWV